MIKLMIHTTVSAKNTYGSRYSVTSYYTPASRSPFLTTPRGFAGGNAVHYAMQTGLTHDEIFEVISEYVPIRQFNNLAKEVEHISSEEVVSRISKELKK